MKRDIIPSEFELARERTQQLLCFWDTKHGVETSQQNTCVSTESKASLHQSNEPDSNLDRAEDDVELIIPSLSALSRDFFSMPQSKIDEGPGRLTSPGKNSSHRGVEAYISASSISNTSNLEESIRRIEKKESSMAASEKSSGNNKAQNTANISNAFADTESNLITSLTSILLDGVQDNIVTTTSNPSPPYSKSSSVALNAILTKFSKTPRRVCQHPFRKNDIVWVCRTCQSDETCVLCHECFTRSNHEGHDVAFYHAQAGGCCDCGDPDAWDPCGFCDLHGHNSDSAKPLLGKDIEDRAKGMVRAIGDWLVEELVDNVEKGWDRINVLSKQGNLSQDEKTNLLQDIGIKGCVDEGLYLVFHSDDIHSMSETSSTLSRLLNIPPSTMTKIHRLFKSNNGNLILWGTCELVAELGPQTAFLWKEKEPKACQQVSSLILEKALIFKERGFNTSVQTRREIQIEQKAIAVLHWLSIVARSCDILCEVVAHSIGEKHLSPLLNTDLKLPRKLTESWHALLLTLLAIPKFKADLAAAYCDSYGKITNEYANGVGVLDCSCFTLSVQFLNREKYVKELVKRKGLLEQLTKALLDTLSLAAEKYQRGNMVSSKRTMNTLELNTMVARGHDNTNERGSTNRNNLLDFSTPPWSPRQLASGEINEQAHSDSSSSSLTLNPLHPVLSNRRYSPCISDLKCVLNVVGMARQFCKYECFEDWLELLSIAQGMDWQVWRTWSLGHVETEPKGWVGAFNASISLGSLFERILIWEEEETPAVTKTFFMRPKSLCLECPTNDTNANLSSEIAGVTVRTLVYIAKWQAKHFLQYTCDENIEHSQLILPYATISAKRGTNLAFLALPFTQTHPWSFHYPLYRFAASCIRECIRRGEEDKGGGVSAVISLLRSSEELSTLSKASPQCSKNNITAQSVDDNAEFINLLRGLCEIPLIILSRAAQIRAGLWKRNGAAMHDQVLNYQEPPFCRALRDSDLNLLQFSIFGLMELNEPLSYFTNLSAHRFGVFDFCGLTSGPMSDQNGYKEEIKSGLYPVLNSDAMEIGDTDGAYELPAIYKPASEDPVATLTLLEELLHLWIILLTELPPQPTSNSHSESIAQAKNRLRREVIHRLASGPKTHSELAEVSYVLPQPDNSALNEEGRILNPDDASGAALESILGIVATQHHSRNYGPNRWELKKEAWDDYDPAFWHIPQRHHQTAAEMRPKVDLNAEGVPYAPKWGKCHKLFEQLRFTFTSDSLLLSVCYRVLHTHCCVKLKSKDGSSAIDSDGKHDQLQGAMAYERDALSETALSRAVHLLTLGAFAWKEAQRNVKSESFGDFKGCIFTKADELTTEEWIKKSLLENPEIIMDSTWYSGEDCLLLLLQRLTVEGGGREGGFVAQDPALRSGTKYLCEFASSHSEDARKLLSMDGEKDKQRKERNAEQRKKEAKEARMRAMKKMSLMTTKFLDGLKEEEEDEKNSIGSSISASASTYPNTDATSDCDTSKLKQKDELDFSDSSGIDSLSGNSMNVCQSSCSMQASCFTTTRRNISLLKERPQCIICVDDNTATQFPEGHMSEDDDTSTAAALEHHSSNKVSSHRKNNALAFCGFAQASTVLKGGGGPLGDSVTRFVGTHVALCGHAVHTSCCDSYLASVAQRESLTGIGDRLEGGKKGEFRCPLCQRLSNCLVPFIDVGLDWIDTPSDGKEESKEMEIDDNVNIISKTTSLQTFLSTSKWAINKSPSPSRSTSSLSNSSFPHKSRRIFSKKDLFAAWNNVMRPRFRRKSSSSSSSNFFPVKSSKQKLKSTSSTKDTSSGATEVWRRLMDQLSDVSHRADWKRLGENDLSRDYGEFRHYLVEKVAYNTHIRMDGSGNNIIEWPSCIVYPSSITDTRKNELSREKLISKLLLSIQAFTYSICSEASDVRRRSGDPSTKNKFGIQSVSPDGFLIQMPSIDSGEQAFDGRLGKLRYLGLAVIAATGAVAREIVPLVLSLSSPDTMLDNVERARPPYRAPIVYPILYGHILTHVVAAICATCGRERIRDETGNSLLGGYDSFEENSSTKMSSPDKKRANYATNADEQQLDSDGDIPLLYDCENFIKIGMIARVLQVLLGKMDFGKEEEKDIQAIDILGAWFGGSIQCDVPLDKEKNEDWSGYNWKKGCFLLMEAAISPLAACRKQPAKTFIDQLIPSEQLDIIEKFVLACDVAQNESLSLLSDAALILQILIPGVVKLKENIQQQERPKSREDSLKHITSWLRIEPLVSILMGPKGALVRGMIAKWYLDAYPIDFTANGNKTDLRNPLNKRLDCKREFRIVDWPLPLSSTVESPSAAQNDKPAVSLKSEGILSQISEATLKSPLPTSTSQLPNNNVMSPFASSSRGSPSTSRISGKKCVQLLGGYYHQIENHNNDTNVASSLSISSTPPPSAASASTSLFPSSLFKRPVTMYPHRPRIKELPTSYTDLYAELGVLCPDTDQKTALCLVCGEILNAGGKGECTKHALRCGGGSGIFFLLQECRGLIVHGGKAAYVHSPYVDSHGETPQYRGRPLNLDLVRYNNLRDLWVGHLVRERVIAERGGSRQVIIPNFY